MTSTSPARFLAELKRRKVVRVALGYGAAAFAAVEAADLIVEAFHLPEWTLTVLVTAVLLGFPVALAAAWAFELTPEGLRRTDELSTDEAASTGSPEWLPVRTVVVALVLVAAGGAAGWVLKPADVTTVGGDSINSAERRSIAVLPFRDLSPAGDQGYFSDGVAEEILNSLAKVGGLDVVARSSSFRYRESSLDVREIGRALGAGTILEGSVRRSGDEVRISAQLIDTHNGYQLWSEQYDRELADIFAIQEQIAARVVSRVRGELTSGDSSTLAERITENTAAYDHYLLGNHYLSKRTPSSVASAIDEYRAALRADPDFLVAHARVAYAYALFVDWGWDYPGSSSEELLAEALAITEEVLRQDPKLADAWLARAYLLVQRDPVDFSGAPEAFGRAIALNPGSAEAHYQYGQALMALGCFAQATKEYRRALRIEPHRAMTLVPLSSLALKQGRVDEAVALADSAVRADPGVSYAHVYRGVIALETGAVERALTATASALRVDSSYSIPALAIRARALARAGDTVQARDQLRRARESLEPEEAPSPTAARYIASALAELGARGEAVQLLERARPRGAYLWFYLLSPEFDALRSDARFQRIINEAKPTTSEGQRCVTSIRDEV